MDNGASSYRRYLDGDDTGLTDIIRDYKDGLTLYINGYVNNIFVAEDLMEETFFKLAIKKPRFNGKSSFKTWLYTIGRNIALNYLKKNSRKQEISIDDCVHIKADDNIERQYIREERKIILHRCMQNLNPKYRQILWLVYFEDFSLKDAASLLDK